jgi:putative ABC transport system ATP-binding protein
MIAPPLEARDLYRFFRAGEEETLALREVSLTAEAGELIAISGPSGSGKSTLLACLAGLDEPDGGRVAIGGERISHRPEAMRARLRARRIGVLFQSANLFGHLTVAQNVVLSQRLVGRGGHRAPVVQLLAAVGLDGRATARPGELSGGEAARAGLAVALANDPLVILADEPTGELDSTTETQILDLLRSRTRGGVAVIIASHSPAVAKAADQIIHLLDGTVVP